MDDKYSSAGSETADDGLAPAGCKADSEEPLTGLEAVLVWCGQRIARDLQETAGGLL